MPVTLLYPQCPVQLMLRELNLEQLQKTLLTAYREAVTAPAASLLQLWP